MIIDKFIRIFLPESTRFVTPFKFLQEGKYILPHHAHLNHKFYWKEVMCGNKWCRQAAVNCGLFSIWWLCLIVEHMQEQEIAWMSSSDESRMLWKESDEWLSGGLYYHVFYMIIKKYFLISFFFDFLIYKI
jgi:hypothetical protein